MRVYIVSRASVLMTVLLCMCTILRAQDVTIIVNRGLPVSQITKTQRDIFIGVRSQFSTEAALIQYIEITPERSGMSAVRRRVHP